jgi:WD40 repeat protein
LKSGQLNRLIKGHDPTTNHLALSPDGRLLATTGNDGMVRLWSTESGEELRSLDGRAERLRGVAFSPDGRTLAATGSDNDVRLWKLVDLARAEARP